MDAFLKDVRFGIRSLLKQPSFTAIAVITLALGLGANTAIFSFVNGMILRPLPFPQPDRLVVLSEKNPEKNIPAVVSPRNLEDWEQQSRTIEQFGAWRDWHFQMTTQEGTTRAASAICSPGLFQVLRVQPARGRLFLPEENQLGHDHVVMISNSYWKTRFASDEKVVGQSITLDKQPFTIIGVLPSSLESLNLGSWDIWAPLTVDPDQSLGRHMRNRRVYARLRPGVTIAEAQAEMTTIANRLAAQYPKENTGWTVDMRSLQDDELGDLRTPMLVFLVTVGMVLLIACTNVANLMLARSASRRKEFAVRVAVGASRFQLLRQLLIESVMLSLVGGAAGLLLALWLISLFIGISPRTLPRVAEIRLDGVVLGFTFLLSILTGILFGLAPALQASRANLIAELKDSPGAFRSAAAPRLRAFLVVSQIALALMLLVGAGLLGRTFVRLTTLKPGYDPDNLVMAQVSVPIEKYKGRDRVSAVYRQITASLESIPGVVSVGASTSGPQFGGFESLDLLPEGSALPPSGVYPQAAYFNSGPNYFHTMGIPMLLGRDFTDQDDGAATRVAIINESLARRFWARDNALGKRLTLVREETSVEVVGVVGDTKRFELTQSVQPEIFFPYSQQPRWAMFFVARTNPTSSGVITAVRSRILIIDPELVVSGTSTMDQRIGRSLKQPRFNLILLGSFAGTALLLATIGVYGVLSFVVAQQTREIGIRAALGARRSDILKIIIGHGMVLGVIGVAIGTVASLALTRFLSGLLYGVNGTDPLTFAVVTGLLLTVVAIACYIPARRALKVDPLIALRAE